MELVHNKKITKLLLALLIFSLAAGESIIFYYQKGKLGEMDQEIAALENGLSGLERISQNSENQLNSVVDKSKTIRQQIDGLIQVYAKMQNKSPEALMQEFSQQKSQDTLLTEAVSEVTPSVVSIVITKDVPKLEIEYINPFGDDPFFKNFNIRIPVYRQKMIEKQKIGAGTGFFINPDGYIVTNRHVVDDEQATYTVLLTNGMQKNAQILYRDPTDDLAIAKIDGANYTKAALGDSDSLALGESIFTIGNALGEYSNSVSTGIVSGLNRTIQASSSDGLVETLTGVIQTDAPINPGNSGGPLATLDGNIVGINVATVAGSDNISFAIPINKLKPILKSVLK